MTIQDDSTHILIIDDDADMLAMLETILSLDGFRVTVCDSGAEGLKAAEEQSPDLIVLDVKMPGKNGIDLMRELRSKQETRDVPILFLSAVGDESVVVEGLKGASDYVLKPFRSLELEARIRNILARSSGRVETTGVRPRVPERLSVHIGNDTYLVPLDQIYYFEASGKYAYAHTRNRRFLTNFSIGEVEERLGRTGKFKRIHRSFMVNTDCVFKITRDERKRMLIVMADENATEIRVSDSYIGSLKQVLGI